MTDTTLLTSSKKLLAEAEAEKLYHQEKLKAAFSARSGAKQAQTMTFINKVIDPAKKKTRTPTTVPRTSDPSTLSFRAGSKTKMTTGKSVIERARREAREANLFRSGKSNLSVPTHLLHGPVGQVRKVPQSMIDKPAPSLARPPTASLSGTATSKTSTGPTGSTNASYQSTPSTAAKRPLSGEPAPSQPARIPTVQERNFLARKKRAAESILLPPKKRIA